MEEKEKNPVVEEVEDEEEVLDPDDFEDDEDETEEDDDSESEEPENEPSEEEEDEKQKEEKAKNAKAAERRRRMEAKEKANKDREKREAKIREEAALEAELGILKVNPYTEKPITDAEDLKIYKMQKELDNEGKDPINDLPQRIAERNRQAAKEAEQKAQQTKQEEEDRRKKINDEIRELRAKYPKVNTSELAADPLFQECLEGRAGRWSQVEIYELYLQRKSEADRKAEEQKSKETVENGAKKVSTPPSSNSRGSSSKNPEDMTPEEFERYFAEKYS